MTTLSEATMNLVISGLMGLLGGILIVPINALVGLWLKRDEISYKHKLDSIAKQREMYLQHKYDMAKQGNKSELIRLEERIAKIEKELFHEQSI